MEMSIPNKINGKEKFIFSILANQYRQKVGFEWMGRKLDPILDELVK